MERVKTIFCDIDGTLWKHVGEPSIQSTTEKFELLPNTLAAINGWEKKGYKIILVTGRRESMRKITEENLQKLGIVYDQLIMGVGNGDRILINDKKDISDRNTAFAVNCTRNKGLEHYDFNQKYVTVKDNQPNEVIKPWGKEELIEYNDKYVMKRLFMKKGESCSMQYHEIKKETIYVLSGILKIYIGKDIDNLSEIILKKDDRITISPYTIHKCEGVEDTYYLESSTNELYDVIRLQDNYGREKAKESDYI